MAPAWARTAQAWARKAASWSLARRAWPLVDGRLEFTWSDKTRDEAEASDAASAAEEAAHRALSVPRERLAVFELERSKASMTALMLVITLVSASR